MASMRCPALGIALLVTSGGGRRRGAAQLRGDVYCEQYATCHLGGGGPAVITRNITLTRSSIIKF